MKRFPLALAGATAMLLSPPAFAFDAFSLAGQQAVSHSFNTMQVNRSNIAMNAITKPRAGAQQQAGGTVSARSRGFAADPANPGVGAAGNSYPAMGYVVSSDLSRKAMADYMARLSRNNPQLAREAQAQFLSHDYNQAYSSLTRGTGMSNADVVDIMAAFTMLGWMIANDSQANPDPAALRSIRDQLAPGLSSAPRLADRAVQAALGEELKIHFVILHAGWQSAKKEGNLGPYSDGVAALFGKQGMNLRSLKLTRAGFVSA